VRTPVVLAAGVLAGAGCASVSPERGHREVAALVAERTGQRTHREKGTPEDVQVAERVRQLLEAGLTRERAVSIALVNGPALQATYEQLGVSQAEMVQAGLLSNPTLSLSYDWLIGGRGRSEYVASLVQNFLDIFVLPLRKRIAEEQFTADTL
jgi:outer membrane protein, heavy metal efflux system